MTITKFSVLVLAGAALMAQTGFDYFGVQRDMFAALSGDTAAYKRAMDACEKALAENPNNAAALVWHGIGSLAALQDADPAKMMATLQVATAEMDKAVALAPDNLGVRIPRGAALMAVSREMPDFPLRRQMMQHALEDFMVAFEAQKDQLDRLGTHRLGELMQGLGDMNSRMGKPEEAEKYYKKLQTSLPGTEYSKRAAQWMETRQPLPVSQTGCVGCHTGQ